MPFPDSVSLKIDGDGDAFFGPMIFSGEGMEFHSYEPVGAVRTYVRAVLQGQALTLVPDLDEFSEALKADGEIDLRRLSNKLAIGIFILLRDVQIDGKVKPLWHRWMNYVWMINDGDDQEVAEEVFAEYKQEVKDFLNLLVHFYNFVGLGEERMGLESLVMALRYTVDEDLRGLYLPFSVHGSEASLPDTMEAGVLDFAFFKDTELQDFDFRGLRARNAVFDCVEFKNVNFSNADFYGMIFPGAVFTNCNFQGADFSGASLAKATFESCDFGGADLVGAVVDEETSFHDCIVEGDLAFVDGKMVEVENRFRPRGRNLA